MIYIFNKDEEPQCEIPFDVVLEDGHRQTLDTGLNNYKYVIPSNYEDGIFVEKEGLAVIRDPDRDFQEFRIKTIETNKKKKHVFTKGTHLELNGDFIRPIRLESYTATQWLDALLSGQQRWQRGIVESDAVRTYEFKKYPTILKAIQTMKKEFGLEIRFRVVKQGSRIVARYVDWLQRRGEDAGKEFVYEKDIK
jgi:phage minor structural protein